MGKKKEWASACCSRPVNFPQKTVWSANGTDALYRYRTTDVWIRNGASNYYGNGGTSPKPNGSCLVLNVESCSAWDLRLFVKLILFDVPCFDKLSPSSVEDNNTDFNLRLLFILCKPVPNFSVRWKSGKIPPSVGDSGRPCVYFDYSDKWANFSEFAMPGIGWSGHVAQRLSDFPKSAHAVLAVVKWLRSRIEA